MGGGAECLLISRLRHNLGLFSRPVQGKTHPYHPSCEDCAIRIGDRRHVVFRIVRHAGEHSSVAVICGEQAGVPYPIPHIAVASAPSADTPSHIAKTPSTDITSRPRRSNRLAAGGDFLPRVAGRLPQAGISCRAVQTGLPQAGTSRRDVREAFHSRIFLAARYEMPSSVESLTFGRSNRKDSAESLTFGRSNRLSSVESFMFRRVNSLSSVGGSVFRGVEMPSSTEFLTIGGSNMKDSTEFLTIEGLSMKDSVGDSLNNSTLITKRDRRCNLTIIFKNTPS